MSMSRDVVLRLIGDATSAKAALNEAATAANVTVREYKRAEQMQRQQAASAKRAAAEQAAAAETIGSSMMRMGAVVVGGLGLAVKAAIDWESSWAGVQKVLKDPSSFEVVEKQLRSLASVLPVTHQEIAAVAAAAAQLGVQDSNVAAFTKTMIQLGATTNLSSEQAAMSIARFSNIMGTSQDQASNLGSTIVYLGNNFATTEAEIVAMALRLAGAGKQAGMTEADVLGMSAAFSSVGIEAEAGGSAISKVMIDMAQSVNDGGDQLANFAKVAGMSASEFSAKWKTDPAAALAAFVEGLGRMQKAGGDVFGTLENLGITEIRMRDALLRSAAAGGVLTDALSGANDAFSANNALQQEAETRFATTASQLALMRNGVVEAGIGLGQALLPALTAVVDAVDFVVDGFNDLPGPVQAAVAVLLALVGATALAGGGFLAAKGKVDEFKLSMSSIKSGGGFVANLGGILGVLGPIGAIIGIVTTGISLFSGILGSSGGSLEDYEGHVSNLTEAFRDSNGAIDENVRAVVAKSAADEGLLDLASKIGIPLDKVTDALLGNKEAYAEVEAQITAYGKAAEEAHKNAKTPDDYVEADKMTATYENAKNKLMDLSQVSKDAAVDAKQLQAASAESGGALDEQAAAAAAAGLTTDEYAQAQADAAQAASDTKSAVSELKDAFDALNGSNVDMIEATSNMTLALAGMADKTKETGGSLDLNTEAGAKNAQMLTDLAKKAGDVATSTLQQTGSMDQAKAAYNSQRQSIIDNAVALGMNKDQVVALLDQIMQMPEAIAAVPDAKTVVTTAPGAVEAEVQVGTLKGTIEETPDGKYVVVKAPSAAAVAEMAALGYEIHKTPDGKYVVTAAPGATEAAGQLAGVASTANTVPPAKSTLVTADTAGASGNLGGIINQIAQIVSKNVTITTTYVAHGTSVPNPRAGGDLLTGGHVQFFGMGGENHVAQYARPGDWRVWAEPETGGEFYIPDALSKRPRSKEIARRMLAGWGQAMVPQSELQRLAQPSNLPVLVNVGGGGSSGDTFQVSVNAAPNIPTEKQITTALADSKWLHRPRRGA